MPSHIDRMIYIDDSGHPASGLVVYGWIECLDTLRCTEGLRLGAVYRRGEPSDLAATKQSLYADLVAQFENELRDSDSLALIVMDGDGSDTSYRTTHRGLELQRRRVIEDAIHIDSKVSNSSRWQISSHGPPTHTSTNTRTTNTPGTGMQNILPNATTAANPARCK